MCLLVFSSLPLHLADELDWPADVSAVQIKLRVKVLLGCDGCWVMRTGALRDLTLENEAQHWKEANEPRSTIFIKNLDCH